MARFMRDEFHGHLGFDRAALVGQGGRLSVDRFSTVFHQRKEVAGVLKDYPLFLMIAHKS